MNRAAYAHLCVAGFWPTHTAIAPPGAARVLVFGVASDSGEAVRVDLQLVRGVAASARSIPRSDGDLMEHFNLKLNTDQLISSVMAVRLITLSPPVSLSLFVPPRLSFSVSSSF